MTQIKQYIKQAQEAYSLQNFILAIECYTKAYELDSKNPQLLFNIGLCHDELGEYCNSIKYYEKALLLNRNDADILNNLATAYKEIKEYKKSIYFYIDAIKIKPDFFEAYNNSGLALEEEENFNDAIFAYLNAIKIKPDFAKAYSNLSGAYVKVKNYQDAINCAARALQLDISLVNACINLGNAFKELGRYDDAIIAYKRALTTEVDNIEAYNNMGAGFFAKGDFDASFEAYQKALQIDKNNPDVKFNISFIHLLNNDYKTGFMLYEERYNQNRKNKPMFYPDFKFNKWKGESLFNKTIVVLCEQGFGDDIMFIRYIPELKKTGAKVTLVCKKELLELFLQLDSVDEFKTIDELIGAYDYWVFLMSLPNFFTHVPQVFPYLKADISLSKKFKNMLSQNKPNIGVVWRGSVLHSNDANRSIYNKDILKPLLECESINFISLQKGEDENVDSICGIQIVPFGRYINNFADSASLISCLDLVISVDTSIVHLCGALDKKCLVMLNSAPEWRWGKNENKTIWYSQNIKLFRQNKNNGWESVISDIIIEIKNIFNI